FFFSSRRRHTRSKRDWSSDVCSSDLPQQRSAEKKYTTFLYDRPMERNLVNNNSGLYVPNDAGTHPIPFGKLATISQIRDSLKSRSEERRVGKECRYGWGE